MLFDWKNASSYIITLTTVIVGMTMCQMWDSRNE